MIQDGVSQAGAARRVGGIGIGVPLLLTAAVGTLGGLLLWATRGWRDGLAFYVGAILLIGALALWRTGWHPNQTAIGVVPVAQSRAQSRTRRPG